MSAYSSDGASDSIQEPGLAPLRLLVAEDNQLNQRLMTGMLSPLDCRIDIVENGSEAVVAVSSATYDLVLMDINMPEMDGIAATKTIRALSDPVGSIPIVAVTATSTHNDGTEFLAAGMNDFVPKPIDQGDLLRAVSRLTDASLPDFRQAFIFTPAKQDSGDQTLNDEIAEELRGLIDSLDELSEDTNG